MNKITHLSLLFFLLANTIFSQSIEDTLSQKKMQKDLEIFKSIRLKANSGLYKYRAKKEIDSIYNWAEKAIEKSSTYREFYNIICQLTDFEGSLHNDTSIPKKMFQSIKNEQNGYFPYPVKWIDGKWIINYEKGEIPLGAEVIAINNEKINDIVKKLYIYYTTDGVNTTGKRIGLAYSFSKYYRLYYGLTNSFSVQYKLHNSNKISKIAIKNISYKNYYKNVENRYSKPFDKLDYTDYDELDEKFSYEKIEKETAILTINTFVIGWDEDDNEHKKYTAYLDSVFSDIKENDIRNLIVDVRHNGGGTDPNDLVTYSYLTNRNFSENKRAWVSFKKIPYLKYNSDTNWPYLFKLIGVGKYNREFQKEFPKEENGKFYQNSTSSDHKIRTPKPNAFNGNVYLLISPRIASAGSLFAAMVAGNKNATVIGEETMGGYYGHNGHTPMSYKLPTSKLEITFSVVNLEQDVPKKENQRYNRGIIPDHDITQNYKDYLNHTDTQMDFVLELIKRK